MSITAVPIRPVKRAFLVWLWVGIAAAVLIALLLAWKSTAAVVAQSGSNEQFLAYNARQPGVETTDTGLQYQVLEPGEGAARPTDADLVLINYTGRFRNGEVFDQSQRPTPMSPTGVIPGFGEGLKLMPKGAKYRFWIKPELGYGGEGRPQPEGEMAVMAESVLVFDVEMVDFLPEAVVRQQMQMQQMLQGPPDGAGAVPGQ